jgi:hypothetical protein
MLNKLFMLNFMLPSSKKHTDNTEYAQVVNRAGPHPGAQGTL